MQHPNAKTLDITVLVRSPEKAKKLEAYGVKTVIGSLDDHAVVEELASKAHVTLNTVRTRNLNFDSPETHTDCMNRLIPTTSKRFGPSFAVRRRGTPRRENRLSSFTP